jgi:hypothetical protein
VSSLKTKLTGVAVAALVIAAPAAALASNPGQGQGQTSTHANHGKSKMHFTANGKVTAVDADSFTMHVKGGSKDLHGSDVTVTVTDTTKMRRNGAKATVADLQVGDRVNAVGSRGSDGTLTARHVNAHGPDATDTTTTEDPAPTDGTTPTDSPTPTPTPTPTDSSSPTV